MIAIVDYGTGNLQSVRNALLFSRPDLRVDIIGRADELQAYRKIILPGVGAIGPAIAKIRTLGFDRALQKAADDGSQILGICLGMQLLATRSFEYGEHPALDLIPGSVRSLSEIAPTLRIPHIGWNEVRSTHKDPLLETIDKEMDFYFVHSFHFEPDNPDHILGETCYGASFVSMLRRDNIWGLQFHPEKSQAQGLALLNNFSRLEA